MPFTDSSTAVAAQLDGVVKQFGKTFALDGLDFVLPRGEVVALLGPNGAGKTTAVKLLLGLLSPTRGRALLFGRDPRRRESRDRVGVMLQVGKVPETLTAREHLTLFASYYSRPLPLPEVIARAGLTGREDRLFGKLSGGERQRVLFALAMIGNPDLLVLDEPTVGLDVEVRRAFWAEIRRFSDEGRTILLTTHYLEEADALADRVVVIDHGRVLADGTTAEIKARTASRRVRCKSALSPDEIRRLPAAREVRRDGASYEVLTGAAEDLVRAWLARDPALRDLEVTNTGLEDAFLALTAPQAAQQKGAA